MSAVETTPPKPVQRWSADDYARNGRFVSELARPVLDLLAPKPGERLDLGCGDGVFTVFEQFQEPRWTEVLTEVIELLRPSLCDSEGQWTADHIGLRFAAERAL